MLHELKFTLNKSTKMNQAKNRIVHKKNKDNIYERKSCDRKQTDS